MSIKIVQLEDYVSNFDGLIDASFWEELGDYTAYPRTQPGEVIERALDADILLINKTPIGRAQLEQLPKLKYIGVCATGYNIVDCIAAKDFGVVVTNVPAYSSDSVAQLVFAHIFNFARGVEQHAGNDWSAAPDFSHVLTPQWELNGLTMGLVGFGAIARKVTVAAQAFGMRVIVFTRRPETVDVPGVTSVNFEELLAFSDIVSIHCPLTAETKGMFHEAAFARMKRTALLINTARGQIVDETALAKALSTGKIAGAGLDVLNTEPPAADNPLLRLPNCRITPHIAWATRQARKRLLTVVRENVRRYLEGVPQNVVN